jgi:hypothetical protein
VPARGGNNNIGDPGGDGATKKRFFKNIIARVIGGAWVFALFVAV